MFRNPILGFVEKSNQGSAMFIKIKPGFSNVQASAMFRHPVQTSETLFKPSKSNQSNQASAMFRNPI